MDFKVNREVISVNETVYDGVQEQSIELDYVLPDYCPEIFKIVKTIVTPRIVSRNVSSDRATYDLAVEVNILYCGENSNGLQSVKQKLNYTKSLDFGKSYENVKLDVCPKLDFVNCRAVNSRRIDLRGAVSIKVKVCADKKQEVITDAMGMNAQLLKQSLKYAASKLSGEKQMLLSEETEINSAKPPIFSIVNSDATIIPSDRKIIQNKVIDKGDVNVKLLYSCEKDGKPALEPMELTIPYSQIIDIDGVDETHNVTVTPIVSGVETVPTGGTDGAYRRIQCEVTVLLVVNATKPADIEFLTDAYSTTFPCNYATSRVRLDQEPINITENIQQTANLSYADGDLTAVCDVISRVTNLNAVITPDTGELKVSGMLNQTVIAEDSKGMFVTLESSEPFEHYVNAGTFCEGSTAEVNAIPVSSTCSLTSGSGVAVKTDIKLMSEIHSSCEVDAITDLEYDGETEKPRDGDYALKLYYGNAGENLWDIAKRYSSSVDSIIEENDLSGDVLTNNNMILIPILA